MNDKRIRIINQSDSHIVQVLILPEETTENDFLKIPQSKIAPKAWFEYELKSNQLSPSSNIVALKYANYLCDCIKFDLSTDDWEHLIITHTIKFNPNEKNAFQITVRNYTPKLDQSLKGCDSTFLAIYNYTRTNIIKIEASDIDMSDWKLGSDPASNLNKQEIPEIGINPIKFKVGEVKPAAMLCRYTATIYYEDGSNDAFTINQKFALDRAIPDFIHLNQTTHRRVTYARRDPNTIKIYIEVDGTNPKKRIGCCVNDQKLNKTLKPLLCKTLIRRPSIVSESIHNILPEGVVSELSKEPTLSCSSGEMLFINNIASGEDGVLKDETDLNALFARMGFRVTSLKDISKNEIEEQVKRFSKKDCLREADVLMVIMMSHGNSEDLPGLYTEVIGNDDEGYPIQNILSHFTSETCPQLQGKSKIFVIVQWYRDRNGCIVNLDSSRKMPFNAHRAQGDMLIVYVSVPGIVPFCHPNEGSYYIQTLCTVFRKYTHLHHVVQLFRIVDQTLAISNPQFNNMSCYELRGFKDCYLKPETCADNICTVS